MKQPKLEKLKCFNCKAGLLAMWWRLRAWAIVMCRRARVISPKTARWRRNPREVAKGASTEEVRCAFAWHLKLPLVSRLCIRVCCRWAHRQWWGAICMVRELGCAWQVAAMRARASFCMLRQATPMTGNGVRTEVPGGVCTVCSVYAVMRVARACHWFGLGFGPLCGSTPRRRAGAAAQKTLV